MTDSERSLILTLRSRGTGYKQIAAALGLPLSTVKAFCRRNTIEENENARKCDMCGEIFEFSPKRPTRRFCCSACRMKWWNAHRDQLKKKAFYRFTCYQCGKPFTAYGNDHRKFCCVQCYTRFQRGEAPYGR